MLLYCLYCFQQEDECEKVRIFYRFILYFPVGIYLFKFDTSTMCEISSKLIKTPERRH